MAKEVAPLGVNELAKHMGVQPATARVLLRRGNIKKAGRSYEFGSKTELAKTADKLRKLEPAPAKKVKPKSGKKSSKKKSVAKRKRPVESHQEAA